MEDLAAQQTREAKEMVDSGQAAPRPSWWVSSIHSSSIHSIVYSDITNLNEVGLINHPFSWE